MFIIKKLIIRIAGEFLVSIDPEADISSLSEADSSETTASEQIFNAEITYYEGDVRIDLSDEEEADSTKPGRIVKSGETLITGEDGLCELDLGGLGVVYVKENTIFDINRLDLYENNVRAGLEVVSGRVVLQLRKFTGKESLALKGSSVICGVRGTFLLLKQIMKPIA